MAACEAVQHLGRPISRNVDGALVPIRVALLDLPSLLSDLIREAMRQRGDMILVDYEQDVLHTRSQGAGPHVVIMSMPRQDMPKHLVETARETLAVRVLGIGADGRETCLYMSDVSFAEVIATIRSSVQADRS